MLRISTILSALFFGFCVSLTHNFYLADRWPTAMFEYHSPDNYAVLFAASIIVIVACVLPVRIYNLQSLFLVPIAVFLFVPTVVITIGNYPDSVRYWLCLAAFTAAIVVACIPWFGRPIEKREPPASFSLLFFSIWAIATAVLVASYWRYMQFVGVAETYNQRLTTAGTVGTAIGYIQSYYLWVINPSLFAIGLSKRSIWPVLAAMVGFGINYAIDAQKISIVLPTVVCGVFIIFNRRIYIPTPIIFAGLSAVLLAALRIARDDRDSYFASIVLSRVVGIPALSFSQYYDFFSEHGFTWWSHIRGLRSILPLPDYAASAAWPELGRIMGGHLFGTAKQNLNANFFVSDGVAAGGAVGILVIGVIYCLWIGLLTRLSEAWRQDFIIPALAPLSLALLSSQLSTTLLSFGGLFWVALLIFWSKTRAPANTVQAPVSG